MRLQPLNLQLVILTPSGREAPFDEWEEPPLLYKEADFFLPVDGFIGRRVNLRCGATWFARTSPLGKDGCGWAFEFPETGDYRVVLRYNMAAGSGENPPVVLESDTLVISVRNR